MPVSHWKGVISFGLVSIPISLYSAKNKSADISFHQIDKRNNARIYYQRINSTTGKQVSWEDIVRGYEYDKDVIIPVPDKILKKVAGSRSRAIDIDSFVAKDDLDMMALEGFYYIIPEKNGEKGYFILRNALKESKKVGIAKVIISTREYLTAVLPYQNALVLCLLKYQNEIKKPEEFDLPGNNSVTYRVKPKEIQMAKQLIKAMTKKWNPESYTDEYKKSIQQWIKETVHQLPHKKSGKSTRKISSKENIIDLLKKSLSSSSSQKKKKIHVVPYKSHRHIKPKNKNAHRRMAH